MNRVFECSLVSLSRCIYIRWARFCRSSGVSVLYAQQRSSHHEQIGQRQGYPHPVAVLAQSSVAHLGEAEDALDHPNGVLDLGPDPGFGPVGCPFGLGELAVAGRSDLGEVAGMRGGLLDGEGLPGIGAVTVDTPLASVQ